MIDYTQLSDDELEAEFARINAERTRRQGLDTVYQQIEHVLDDAERKGLIQRHEPGDPWEQPSGAHDAYRRDDETTHLGKIWVSTVTPNVWEPGVSGWREKPGEDPETGEPHIPEYVQPTGAHDAYNTGEQILWEDGEIYESVIDGNVWSPADHPAGWKRVDGEPS